ncbi:MAG: RluA family pseudouridine synthase [Acidobacteria bacterium]|nr:RluA family pseudouridine synthase [Acidobacteriota bacterium]
MPRERLDRRLRALHPDLSWTRIRNGIERGQVTVNGEIARDAGQEVAAPDQVQFDPSRRALSQARLGLVRLYEDQDILVIDKPAGLLSVPTHPDLKASEETVLRRAQEYARYLQGRTGYAGVLHRLDRDTSGALAIALSRDAHRAGRELFATHDFDRWYLAVVQGVPSRESGTIDAPISNAYVSGRRYIARDEDEGRPAVTHYHVRETYRGATLLELRLETGRQHQIRLHLQALGHPLLGDKVYAEGVGRPRARRQMLHAWRLSFPHPLNRDVVSAEAPIPRDFAKLCVDMARHS